MASAFFSGFANTLKDIRLDDRKRTRDLEDADALQRLKKKYEAEIVDNSMTKIIGSDEVRYNKFGDEIGRRTLSPEELSARKAELAKIEADAATATATAGIKNKELGSYDKRLSLDEEVARSGMRNDSARVSIAQEGNNISRERLNADISRLDKGDESEVIALIQEANGMGASSADALQERYLTRLDSAKTKQERERIVAEYKGAARSLLNRIKQENAIEQRRAAGGGMPEFKPLDAGR